MKRKLLYISVLLLSVVGSTYAQGEMDAYRMSQTDLLGTARSVGMGGAVGAMGGEISAISVNPAGIGYFSTSQVVTTLNFQNVNTKSTMNAGDMKEDKFKFNFNNLAFVGTFPIDSDVAPLLNFGFSFNRLKNFDRKYSMRGDNTRSIAEYMAYRFNGANLTSPDTQLAIDDYNSYYPFDRYDWMPIFGYNSGLIKQKDNGTYSSNPIAGTGAYNDLFVQERGYVDTYDFNFGTNIDDVVSVGLTVSVTDLDYRRYSYYSEAYNDTEGFFLENSLKTEGTGVQVAAGVIVKPIPEFRFGLAYHSPTWYNMTDYYDAVMDYNIQTKSGVIDSWSDGRNNGFGNYTDYRFRTPDRLTFSATGLVGPVILSADYEFTNYKSNMRLGGNNGNLDWTSDYIDNHYKGASTLRVGAEIGFTKQFTGRVGYAWKESPVKSNIKNGSEEVMTVGSDSQYLIEDDTHHITWGLGYRFTKNIFADVAFVYKMQDADLYSFYGADKATMKTNTFQGLLTLGFRF